MNELHLMATFELHFRFINDVKKIRANNISVFFRVVQ